MASNLAVSSLILDGVEVPRLAAGPGNVLAG